VAVAVAVAAPLALLILLLVAANTATLFAPLLLVPPLLVPLLLVPLLRTVPKRKATAAAQPLLTLNPAKGVSTK
jgi:hypothetical protein